MHDADYRARLERVQRALADENADLAVLFPSSNLQYLAGFDEEPAERHLFLFVPQAGDPVFVVPSLYETQVRAESWVDAVVAYPDDADPMAVVDDVLDSLGVRDADEPARGRRRSGDASATDANATDVNTTDVNATDANEGDAIEANAAPRVLVDDSMWATFTQDLRDVLPEASWGLASEAFGPVRIRKDDAEIAALREAGRVADEVSEWVRERGADVVGLTETELAGEIEAALRERGATELAFPVIVGSGPNGAMPHHTHGDREIQSGDPVVLDFGGYVADYPGDQTRTVVFAGDPPDEFERVHDVVREAQQAGVDAVEPGVEAQTVDAAAREVIADAGYGDAFVHRTGHGVGLDVHEPPYVVDGNDRTLEPGMVCSIEPGVYLDDRFGVRIEDLVVVTTDGCERLNHTDHGWQCP